MDISSAREPAITDLASFTAADPTGIADAATAVSAPLSGDAISTSPLTFFGGVVEQIGKAMANDASANGPATGGANSAGFDHAIGLLEGVIGLMSAYGDDPSSISSDLARLASSEPSSGVD